MPIVDDALIGRIFREESGRSVATLIRTFGDIDFAEDALDVRTMPTKIQGLA